MIQSLVERTAHYVKMKLYNEPSGHDWYHVERVWNLAKKLQKEEGGNLQLIELVALLHNLGDYSHYKLAEEHQGNLALYGMMDILGIEEPLKSNIIELVGEMKFKGDETKPPTTIEGKIVQDANLLDTLGAIGIARCFASGGYHKRPIFDPKIRVRRKLNKTAYLTKKQESTSINSFYEKALKIAEQMNTSTGKRIAKERSEYVKKFIAQFLKEWEEGNHVQIPEFKLK